jgi:curved DNA-binding protein CbpA
MEDDIEEHDWYAILEVPMTATEEDISKAFRQLARLNHPDRNKDDPNAGMSPEISSPRLLYYSFGPLWAGDLTLKDEWTDFLFFLRPASKFQLIKRASQLLLDAPLRATYDAKIQARLLRKKRDREASESLRTMKEMLFAREAAAAAAAQTQVDDLYRLRDETAALRTEQANRAAKKAEQANRDAALKATLPASFHITTVVLKWRKDMNTYSEGDIAKMMKPFGSVEATIMNRSAAQATVLFSSHSSATKAVESLHPEGELGVKMGIMSISVTQSTAPSTSSSGPQKTNLVNPSSKPLSSASFVASSSSGPSSHQSNHTSGNGFPSIDDDDDFERMVLEKMRGGKKGKPS